MTSLSAYAEDLDDDGDDDDDDDRGHAHDAWRRTSIQCHDRENKGVPADPTDTAWDHRGSVETGVLV